VSQTGDDSIFATGMSLLKKLTLSQHDLAPPPDPRRHPSLTKLAIISTLQAFYGSVNVGNVPTTAYDFNTRGACIYYESILKTKTKPHCAPNA